MRVKLLAQGKLEKANVYGKSMSKDLLETTYQSIAKQNDPAKGLRQFVITYRSLFNFGVLEYEEIDARHFKIHLDYHADDEGSIAYCHQLQGMLESVIAANGAKNGQVVIAAKQWEGASKTTYEINWE
ncbi:MAG: TIGR02265 family protein [Desulfosudaceae bacterium]